MSALVYAFLAGFAPPVQRALIGVFSTLYCMGKQRFSAWQIWRYALFGVLCLEPHAVLMQGFYFSFLAVACLLLTQQRWCLSGYKANFSITIKLFNRLNAFNFILVLDGLINGFVANLFAIPLVGFLIVPLALITMVFCTTALSYC